MNYETVVAKSEKVIEEIKKELEDLLTNIPYEYEYRIKSEKNMIRKKEKKKFETLTEVEDIVGFRILLKNEEWCHKVYSILTNYYHPYKISNYFEKPKETGFKAYLLKLNQYEINTEIQIMTCDMKEITEKTHQIHENKKYDY